MKRRRYLACYDIRDPKRLRRIHRMMRGYGYPLQYSVFVCDLDAMERVRLRTDASEIMHLDIDSVVIIDLGDVSLDRFEFLGSQDFRPPSPDALIL